jgi:hypothetical protein
MNLSPDVKAFLERPNRRFADVFMNADPNRCTPVERASLGDLLPRRRELFQSAGAGPLRLVEGSDEALDDDYVLARTSWETRLRDGGSLRLRSTFILRRTDDDFEVVFYLNHQDLPALLAGRAAG